MVLHIVIFVIVMGLDLETNKMKYNIFYDKRKKIEYNIKQEEQNNKENCFFCYDKKNKSNKDQFQMLGQYVICNRCKFKVESVFVEWVKEWLDAV